MTTARVSITPIQLWRCWHVATDSNGRLELRPPYLPNPDAFGPIRPGQERGGSLTTSRKSDKAVCWISDHPAPSMHCSCGHRVMVIITGLTDYLANEFPAGGGHLWAVAAVAITGPIGPGIEYDPPGTLRVAQMDIIGPVYLYGHASPPELVELWSTQLDGIEIIETPPGIADFDSRLRWLDHLDPTTVPIQALEQRSPAMAELLRDEFEVPLLNDFRTTRQTEGLQQSEQ